MEIRTLRGAEIAPHLDDLARLRIAVFRDFPYLYDGDVDYEANYLRTYAQSAGSLFVLAIADGAVVGAATGMPLAEETGEVKAPFLARGWDPGAVFYFGESVLLGEFRGRGIGVRFFAEREGHAKGAGFGQCAFCAVVRAEDHPRRPQGYVPLDGFWRRRGFVARPELETTFSWRDLDEDAASPKRMRFWTKAI